MKALALLLALSAPVLEISPAKPRQGQIVVVTLRSATPLSSARLFDGEREIPLEPSKEGHVYRALLGIDFESDAGKREIRVSASGPSGESSVVKPFVVSSGKFPTQSLKVAPAYVEPPPEEQARIAADREKVKRVYAAPDSPRRFDSAFRRPVVSPSAGSFGVRRVFNGQPRAPHDGVDLAAPQGEPVVAAAPAAVVLAEDLYFSGNTVILDHGAGLFTTYFHLSAIDVGVGDVVGAGQRIGAVGATGRATGPHLHWGARLHRSRVNPLDLLRLPAWPAPAFVAR